MFFRLFCRAPMISTTVERSRESEFRRASRSDAVVLPSTLAFCTSPSPGLRTDPAVRRHRDRLLPAQIRPGERAADLADLVGRALGDDLAAAVARAGAEVEQVVGRLDHLAVVLDEDQRVAQVAELLQRLEQPAVVARVQADRRLVEHVQHAGQAAADLAGQADALASPPESVGAGRGRASDSPSPTSTRNCKRFAISRTRSPAIFLLAWLELPGLESVRAFAQRQLAELVERLSAKPDGRRVVAQAAAVADRAGDLVDQVLRAAAASWARAATASSIAGNRPLYWKRKPAGRCAVATSALPPSARGADRNLKPFLARAVQDRSGGAAAASSLERHVERNPGAAARRRRASARTIGSCTVGPQTSTPFAQRQLRDRGAARPGWRRSARPAPRRPGTSRAGC